MAVTSFLADSTFRSGNTSTTSTVTGVTFGTASADRVVCVFFFTDTKKPTAVTIGGVSAVVTGSAAVDVIFMASAIVPTGTSGNVVATFSSSDTIYTFGAARLTGAANATPSDTINVTSGSTPSGTIDVGAGGSVVAGCAFSSSGGWTGLTALFTDTGNGDTVGHFDNSGSAITGRTVSYAASGGVIVGGAFTASGGGGTTYTLTAAQGSFSLSGVAATLRSARNLSASVRAFSLTGVSAGLKYGRTLTAAKGTFALTGVSANFARTYVLGSSVGSFALTGQNSGLAFGRKLGAVAGSFAVTGISASLERGYSLGAGTGSFALSGVAASFHRTYALTAAKGVFALSGQTAGLKFGHVLGAAAGTFSLSGQSATLRTARNVSAGVGGFALTGVDAALTYTPSSAAYTLTASVGSFSLSGVAATLRASRKLTANTGSIVLSGQSATLAQLRKLIAGSGIYVLAGNDASLVHGGGSTYSLEAEQGVYSLGGNAVSFVYVPLIGIRNPLERLKMYTGSMGSVSNREDWIVNISLVGDDGTSFDLTGADIFAFVCKEGRADCPVLSASLDSGIVLTDNYTMQWHFTEKQMAQLCAQQYEVYCRVERDEITTQILSANVAILEGGPAS